MKATLINKHLQTDYRSEWFCFNKFTLGSMWLNLVVSKRSARALFIRDAVMGSLLPVFI